MTKADRQVQVSDPLRRLLDLEVAVSNGSAWANGFVDDARISRLRPAGFVSTELELDTVADFHLLGGSVSNIAEMQKDAFVFTLRAFEKAKSTFVIPHANFSDSDDEGFYIFRPIDQNTLDYCYSEAAPSPRSVCARLVRQP